MCSLGRRYTRTGNSTGNLSSAQRLSLRNNFLRKSLDIGQPHNRQPVLPVSSVENQRNLLARVPDGLLHPQVRVASLHPLHLQVNVRQGLHHIRGIRSARKLLASATGRRVQAESLRPRLGRATLASCALGAAVGHFAHLASRPL